MQHGHKHGTDLDPPESAGSYCPARNKGPGVNPVAPPFTGWPLYTPGQWSRSRCSVPTVQAQRSSQPGSKLMGLSAIGVKTRNVCGGLFSSATRIAAESLKSAASRSTWLCQNSPQFYSLTQNIVVTKLPNPLSIAVV
jgi:hypothetical protein